MSSVHVRPLFASSSTNHLPLVTANLPISLPGGVPAFQRDSQSPLKSSSK